MGHAGVGGPRCRRPGPFHVRGRDVSCDGFDWLGLLLNLLSSFIGSRELEPVEPESSQGSPLENIDLKTILYITMPIQQTAKDNHAQSKY